MIEYTLKKRFYTQGSEFITLQGSNYTGYVTVLSGIPYIDNSQTELIMTDRYESSVYTSPYIKNRAIIDTQSLPYNENDVLIAANDFLTYELFKSSLDKLETNNTFVYSNMFIANNNIPTRGMSFAYLLSSNSAALSCSSGLIQSIPFAKSSVPTYAQLGNIRKFATILGTDSPDSYSIFAITPTEFTTLKGDISSCRVVESYSDTVESSENILRFGELFDITQTQNFIFITDSKNNCIYKYDISGYYNGDVALGDKRNLLEILGGDGPATALNLFKTPQHITSNDEFIIVHDSGNKVLKVYDLNFNYITRIASIPLRTTERLASLEINKFHNLLYVLTYSSTPNKLNLYLLDTQGCFEIVETYKNIDITLLADEQVVNIDFAKNNSDYYYICTNKQVYKLFVSRPSTLIGRYQELNLEYFPGIDVSTAATAGTQPIKTISGKWGSTKFVFGNASVSWNLNSDVTDFRRQDDNTNAFTVKDTQISQPNTSIYNDTYKGIKFLGTSSDYDYCVFVTDGRVYFYRESNTFKLVIKDTTLTKVNGNTITLDPNENIQASTINKEIYKVVRNILVLKNNLVGRFTGKYDNANIFTLTDYNYNINFDDFNIVAVENFYIHENEKALVTVLNRCFKKVLELQNQLITLTSTDTSSTVKQELTLGPNLTVKRIS